jgi:hypothetical protein
MPPLTKFHRSTGMPAANRRRQPDDAALMLTRASVSMATDDTIFGTDDGDEFGALLHA